MLGAGLMKEVHIPGEGSKWTQGCLRGSGGRKAWLHPRTPGSGSSAVTDASRGPQEMTATLLQCLSRLPLQPRPYEG